MAFDVPIFSEGFGADIQKNEKAAVYNFLAFFLAWASTTPVKEVLENQENLRCIGPKPSLSKSGGGVITLCGHSPPPLCFEWGFTRTFPWNQDVAVE